MRPAIIGPLGPAQLACIRSWTARGWPALFIHLGERPAPAVLRGMLAGYLHVPNSVADANCVTWVRGFLDQYRATGLTCLSYNLMRWLHQHEAEWPPTVTLWIATEQALPVLRSKERQIEIARAVGLPLLESMPVGKACAGHIPPQHFPLVLRPDDESKIAPSFKMELIANERKLADFLDSRSRIECSVIGQRFINGPNLVVHGARTRDGVHRHLAGFIVHRKLDGVSLTIEPVQLSPAIAEGCRAFVEHMSHVGIYHFELLFDAHSDTYYFLEINGRLGGTTGKVFAAGYDEPLHLVEAFCDDALTSPACQSHPRAHVYTNKRSVGRAILVAVQGKGTIFDYPGAGSRRSSWALLGGLFRWHDEIFMSGHFRSALAYTMHAALSKHDTGASMRAQFKNIRIGKAIVESGKGFLQRILRALFGNYQVFHIMSYSVCAHAQDDVVPTVNSSDIDKGYRFSVERDGVAVCVCQFWTAAASNMIRDFIPLEEGQAELVLLETDPKYRKQGLGGELVIGATAAMVAKGFGALYARIWHSNKASLRTFHKARWQYVYTIIEVYPLRKRLQLSVQLPTWVAP